MNTKTIGFGFIMVFLTINVAGCGLSGEAGRCDFRAKETSAPRCQDWNSSLPNAKASYKAACEASGGVYADESCPLGDSVGGCKQNANNADGSEVIDYYYPPRTAEETMTACESQGEEYVAP